MGIIIELYKNREYAILGLLIIIVLPLAVWIFFLSYKIVDHVSGNDKTIQVTVLEKLYQPSRTTIGTGVGLGMDGKAGLISTSSHENEKFNLIVKDESGEVFTFSADPTLYANAIIGGNIDIIIRVGGISKSRI